MTTLAEVTLSIASKITDVLRSTATAGAATSLTDTVSLIQPAGHWKGGVLWILSGTHAGKMKNVDSYAAGVLSFSTLGSAMSTDRYAVARKTFPMIELFKAVNQALEEEGAMVTSENTALTGDGSTLEFILPAGVFNIKEVKFEGTSTPAQVTPSYHWEERNGKIIFDNGYAPYDGYTIQLLYRTPHAEVTAYSDTIDSEINPDWLKWKAIENLMVWALHQYGESPQNIYSASLQNARDMLMGKRPLRRTSVMIKSA